MCIYYKNRNDLTYIGQEHVIPAGLGGLAKLPKTFVSDQFNTHFSKIEQSFLRESIIGGVRQIIGPGSRGRMTERYETKSKVHVLRDYPDGSNLSLGYIRKGKPYLISYIILNTATNEIGVGFNNFTGFDPVVAFTAFKEQCAKALELKIRRFIDNALPVNMVLFGIGKDIEENYDAFFVKNESNPCIMGTDLIQAIGKSVGKNVAIPEASSNKIKSAQTAVWKEEYFRLYGKMLFNLLAHIKGEEFVQQDCLNDLREWIIHGGENRFAQLSNGRLDVLQHWGLDWPEDAHIFLLMTEKDTQYALCSLYNSMVVRVEMANHVQKPIHFDGLICDWKNRRECRIGEFVAGCAMKIAQQQTGNSMGGNGQSSF